MEKYRRLNDKDREKFILKEPGLRAMYRRARLPMKKFISENRAAVDMEIKILIGERF